MIADIEENITIPKTIDLNKFSFIDFKILIDLLSINLVPPFATITGSNTTLLIFNFFNENKTFFMTDAECNIPILIAFGLISLAE